MKPFQVEKDEGVLITTKGNFILYSVEKKALKVLVFHFKKGILEDILYYLKSFISKVAIHFIKQDSIFLKVVFNFFDVLNVKVSLDVLQVSLKAKNGGVPGKLNFLIGKVKIVLDHVPVTENINLFVQGFVPKTIFVNIEGNYDLFL